MSCVRFTNAYKGCAAKIMSDHHCFFPFFFLLLALALLLLPPLLVPFPVLPSGLSVEVLALELSNMPVCTAFCNHSKNSSSVMVSSTLNCGIRPPFCPELVPFPLLCLEVTLVLTWKLGLWVLAGHLIPCIKFSFIQFTFNVEVQHGCKGDACGWFMERESIS